MLPKSSEDLIQFEMQKQPSYTYRMNVQEETVRGHTDKAEAVKQAIYKILHTERYQYPIYSWNYGITLKDLFGRSYGYVCSELPGRITEALTQDDRIQRVENFQFSRKGGTVSVTFTAITTEGPIHAGMEAVL